jgi:hypothetical protein
MITANWYDDMIEEGVRDVVRMLRDNGFNTSCSCHHEMMIQIDYLADGAIRDLHNLLFHHLDGRGEKISYRITVRVEVSNMYTITSFIEVELLGREKRATELPATGSEV